VDADPRSGADESYSLLNETSSAGSFASLFEDGTVVLKRDFSISGVLCTPYNNTAPKTVQLLIHGCASLLVSRILAKD
jgi:hypothetical protein